MSIQGEPSLNGFPPVSTDYCWMLTGMPDAIVFNLADVKRVRKDLIDMPARE